MKSLMQSVLCLQLVAMSLTTLLAGSVAAENEVPFKGTIQSVETTFAVFPPDVPFPTLFVEGSGSGHATHLGKYTTTFEFEINIDAFVGFGSYHFIAANGDSIFTEIEGIGTVPTEDGVSFLLVIHTITGGTGRFEGATGSFIEESVLNVFTHVKSGSFEGTISK